MPRKTTFETGRLYLWAVAATGIGLWLWAVARILTGYPVREQLIFLGLVPLILLFGHFTQHFRIPFGLDLTQERMTVSLSDGVVLLVACWYGIWPAVFVAGIEGFIMSRRTVRRLSSNLFSFGMMSLAAGAGGAALAGLLGLEALGAAHATPKPAFYLVAPALFVASVAHNIVNMGLLFTLVALRHNKSIWEGWRSGITWAAPILCLPTAAAAILMYHALEQGLFTLAAISVPALLAINLGQRQNRRSTQQSVDAVEKAHRETVEALAVAINAKDQVTHEHVLRVQIYSAGVARLLGCTDAEIDALRAGALLHDIGKIAVPDYILNKPGKLTAAEFDKMKIHTVVGAQILGRVDFPYPVVPVVRHHHERWDGKGYPDGLKGEDIPLTARVLSVVDCFDAVREDRQYRRGLTRDEAIKLIMDGSGTQYDPRVVGTFVTHLPEFEAEIQARRGDAVPSFGIEPQEALSQSALEVAPAAGLAADGADEDAAAHTLSEGELRRLGELADALEAARPDAARVVEVFLSRLALFAPFDTCAVTLAGEDEGEPRVADAAGEHAELLRGRRIAHEEGVTGWVIANEKAFFNVDPSLDFDTATAARFAGYRTLAAVPVSSGRRTPGALTLYSSSLAEYTPAHRRLLQAAAAVLATALAPAARATPEVKLDHPSLHNGDAPPTVALDGDALKRFRTTIESKLTH